LKLQPVSYFMKGESKPKRNWGFIAQDIEQLVGTDNAVLTVGGDQERTLGLRYTDFIAPLVKSVQEQQAMIEKQQMLIDKLLMEVQSQGKEIQALKNSLSVSVQDPIKQSQKE
ncbi:MAG: tail fiber domain-containing protein, partial [Cyclobacteriaceae bacterium]|nr:tail fiber domain-containing protein [Cyclobacteriaceae bacterium]